MSLIWPEHEADVALGQAGLHALVVGVGSYPHLNGGTGALASDPLGLSQVTTPPITAIRIAKWLLNSYRGNECPLGSLEVLLSPDQEVEWSAGKMVKAEPARFSLIDQAFNRWVHRCSAQSANKAFFYFCGHGLSKGSQFILPEDFGDPQWVDPWRNNIDFDAMRVGMRSCKAQTQLFFVDACRETPFGLLDQVGVSGQSLIKCKFSDQVRCSAAYYATAEGKKAFGPEDGVTYFGQAVIKCLDGAGCGNSNGHWIVDTYSLSRNLGEMMEHFSKSQGLPLTCNPNVSGKAAIHEPSAPCVIASIGCRNQPDADSVAEILMQRGAEVRRSTPGKLKPMIEEVPPGDWEIQVAFPGGEFPGPFKQVYTLLPPVFEGVPAP